MGGRFGKTDGLEAGPGTGEFWLDREVRIGEVGIGEVGIGEVGIRDEFLTW